MIEDTSFIIDILRDNEDALKFLDIIESEKRPEKISSITVLELYEGLIRSNASTSRRQKVLDVLNTKHVVDADTNVMRRAGRLSGDLFNRGKHIDREDCIIAATAIQEDEPLITRNTDHFERIDGLTIRSY
ncbi:MAG: PIN domain-containing protein [Halobacteriaceae archaeon]